MGLLCTVRWLEEGARSSRALWRLGGGGQFGLVLRQRCGNSSWMYTLEAPGSSCSLDSSIPASWAGPALTSRSMGSWKERHHLIHTQVVKGLAQRAQWCGQGRPSQWP